MRKRTKAREYALQVLYQIDVTKSDHNHCLEDFWRSKEEQDKSVVDFASILVKGTIKNVSKIDESISAYATNWDIKRMAVVDRNVLRLASYELLFMDDIPPKVSINEAVDIAKKYGDKDSGKFVNGILDKISKAGASNGKKS